MYANDRRRWHPVVGLSGVTQIALGGAHSCAKVGGGAVYCWGFNGNGQLGVGDKTIRLVPTLTTPAN